MILERMLNPATQTHIQELQGLLPEAVFGAEIASYLDDPRRILKGQAAGVLRPGSTEEVATIIRFAAQKRIGVIPYGGGTGLVGGQLSPDDLPLLVLSLERMSRIRDVFPRENILIAEAGVTLSTVQEKAEDHDRLFPLSLASEGTARIGGNLSTNAGGVQVLRYGNARDLCLGLEAVLPGGQIWNGLRRLRKDNTGYDLRNLLIGAEGTLGVITAASLRLFPRPTNIATALLAVTDPDAALDLLGLFQDRLGAGLTAFELIGGQGLRFLDELGLPGGDFLAGPPDWAILAEVAMPESFDAQSGMEECFAIAHEQGLVADGVIAQTQAQRQALWTMRETLPEANRRIGAIASHDISVPLGEIPGLITEGRHRIAELGEFRANIFGHLGDGNLHFNLFPVIGKSRDDYPGMRQKITRLLHDLTHERGGSFSAEHGIGRMKVHELERLGDPAKVAAMRAIKAALDPGGIMNPGAVLR